MSSTESTQPTLPVDGEARRPTGDAVSAPSSTPRVTQEMLASLVELRLVAAEQKQLRLHILGLLDEDAEIEPGPLTAEVVEREQRMLGKRELQALLGEDRVE